MKRVIFINRFYYPDQSATSQILTDLSVHLSNKGYSVIVVTSRLGYENASKKYKKREKYEGVDIVRVWSTKYGRYKIIGRVLDYVTFYVGVVVNLMLNIKRGDIVIVKTDPPLIASVAAIVASIKGAMLISWIQDLFPEVATNLGVSLPTSFLKAISTFRDYSFKQSSGVITISDAMKEKVTECGVPHNKIKVIHNWANDDDIVPIDKGQNWLLDKWKMNGKFIVGYSGNMGRVHELMPIIEIARALSANKNIVFLLVGGGVEKRKLMESVEEYQLDNVVFKPYQKRSDLTYSLSVPDVHIVTLKQCMNGLVLPSKVYGILAAGRPVIFIGSTSGDVPNIINEFQCGKAFNSTEVNEIVEYIRFLAMDEESVNTHGRRARITLDRKYSKDFALNEWERTISQSSPIL